LQGIVSGDTVTINNSVGNNINVTSSMSLGGSDFGNYNLTGQPTLSAHITAKSLIITADNTNKVYGTSIDFIGDEFTYIPSLLPNSEVITNVTLESSEAVSKTTPVGSYVSNIVASVAMGDNGFHTNNYNIIYVPGNLEVGQRALTITSTNTVKIYGNQYLYDGTQFVYPTNSMPNNETITNVVLDCAGWNISSNVGIVIAPSAFSVYAR